MRQLVYTVFISNNRVSFYLWWKKNLLKHQKVSKYYESGCSNNQLVPSVYCKEIFSGVFTNFESFMPVAYKFGLAYTLLHCWFSICSSYEKFHEEIELLKGIFKKSEYPQLFIDKCIKKYLSKLFIPKRTIHTVEKKQILLVLPFLGYLSSEIRSRLQKCFKNYIHYCSLKVVYQSKSRISNLIKL